MKIDESVIEKAKYCLNCKNKPCSKACPMNTQIPEFINEIVNSNLEEAYNILIENNIFSHICSIVCPYEKQCEGSCVRGIKQKATEIGYLEKYVNEWAEKNQIKKNVVKKEKNDKSIAVIGAGPSGLEVAYELGRRGYSVTIFEKEHDFIGGVLAYGIPDFRLNKKHIENIINILKEMGIEFSMGKKLGKDMHIKELLEKYDAVFLGIGAEVPSVYDLGEFDNVFLPDKFLKDYNQGNYIKNLGNVAIIGGGNVAVDTSRVALKMGAKSSTILYRRNEENMPASKKEIEDAINDGVKVKYTTRVIEGYGLNRKLEKLKCIKTEIIDGKAIDIPSSEFEVKSDSVIFAIGQKPNRALLEKEGIEFNDNGLIKVDEKNKTNIDRVYAGGDLKESRATVCKAIQGAKIASNSIIEILEGDN